MAKQNLDIRIKRVYEPPDERDGHRFLVDRLWPRGVRREDLKLDGWLKDVAPSDKLRTWFGHHADRWMAFRERYIAELDGRFADWAFLADLAATETVTLLYAARDQRHNNAVALCEFLRLRSPKVDDTSRTGRHRSPIDAIDRGRGRVGHTKRSAAKARSVR